MKKYLLSIALTLAFLMPNAAQAQDVIPEILSLTVAPLDGVQGAFINWRLEGEDANATAFRVLQMVDGEFQTITETALDAGFHYNEVSLVDDGPQTYAVALIDADGETLSTSETHSTVFVSVDSEECDDPILISWTPYVGFDVTEQKIYIGQMPNDPAAEVFTLDGTAETFSYTPTDIDSGTELFISVAALEGASQSASNVVNTTTCGSSSGIESLRAHLAVGPNPTTENIAFSLNTSTDERLTLSAYSTDGRQVYNAPFSQQATIAVADWVNGIYVYKLSNDEGSVLTGKILKN